MIVLLNDNESTIFVKQSEIFLNTSNASGDYTLIIGTRYSPYSFDPVDNWGNEIKDILQPSVETLFTYNLSNPDLPLINQLAESYSWINSTMLLITLRQGVLFHDNTPFNAAAAKWNLDRLLYLTDCTGTNTGRVARPRTIWLLPDGVTPIISHVDTIGEWDLLINLNAPYSPLLHQLTYINTGMLSPSSTPQNDYINITSGQLVGTGPFIHEVYVEDVEINFTRWDNYWRAPTFFEKITYKIFDNSITLNDAMLVHDIDILDTISLDHLPMLEADPDITVKKFTDDTGKPGLIYWYLGFNNQKFNQTWRKIMSHAINYSYIIKELRDGYAERANSPISPGFGNMYNEDATAAIFNITKARLLMQSMGFGIGFTTDQEWIDQANTAPFLSINFTYYYTSQYYQELYLALNEWYKHIGIHVQEDAVSLNDYIQYLAVDQDHLELFHAGWLPDFLDPHNMMGYMFTPNSEGNYAQIDDPWLTSQLTLALETRNETRIDIYKDIQKYVAEVGYFQAPLFHSKVTYVHLNEIQGIQYNSMELLNVYSIYRELPIVHDLEVNLEIPTGIEINASNIITVSVRNIGSEDETNVQLFLSIDEVIVDSLTIPDLPVGSTGTLQYEWTPSEYKTYTFKAHAPPVPGEVSLDDNTVIIDVPLAETPIFDGLTIGYIFDQMGYDYDTNFTYIYFQDTLFYETWNLTGLPSYQWIVDSSTRLMSNGSVFGDGTHTPVWIYTDVTLGDVIPIAVNGEGDHMFNVVDEFIYDLPGFGPVGVWVLEDLNYSGGIAWYEQSTGILLNGLFYYYNGTYNYTLEFTDTNAQFMYLGEPGPFTLSSDAEDPDSDGIFTLSWTESDEADSYSVYQHSSFITEITGELILLADGITDLSLPLEECPTGTYYFIVVAHNEYGDTLSNCIQVNVELSIPLTIIYDTIPDESLITYTRSSQIIGSISAYSSAPILFVGLVGEVDPGFALVTTYTENGGISISETTVMTTNQLEPGVNELTLRIWNTNEEFYDKNFTIIIYRQAELNLRGEFDYLLKEKVKISLVAQAFDVEDQFLLSPTLIEGMMVHIKIVDYDGNIKAEDTMTYNPDGYFHWDSTQTIKQLEKNFTKGVYIVQAWIEFPPDSYYLGGVDVIEFHIDPPSEDEIDPWLIIGLIGFTGLIGVNITLAILLKQRRLTE